MENMFGLNLNTLILICLVVFLIIFILMIIILIVLKNIVTRYRLVTNGSLPQNLEQVIIDIQKNLKLQKKEINQIGKNLQEIKDSIKTMKSNVGIHRYNPFSDKGNKFSFSLAILDDTQSGVIITSLYNGESSFIYAKSIQESKSESVLSKEELIAIDLAINNKLTN